MIYICPSYRQPETQRREIPHLVAHLKAADPAGTRSQSPDARCLGFMPFLRSSASLITSFKVEVAVSQLKVQGAEPHFIYLFLQEILILVPTLCHSLSQYATAKQVAHPICNPCVYDDLVLNLIICQMNKKVSKSLIRGVQGFLHPGNLKSKHHLQDLTRGFPLNVSS